GLRRERGARRDRRPAARRGRATRPEGGGRLNRLRPAHLKTGEALPATPHLSPPPPAPPSPLTASRRRLYTSLRTERTFAAAGQPQAGPRRPTSEPQSHKPTVGGLQF